MTLLKFVKIDIILVVGIEAADVTTTELLKSDRKVKILWIVDEADLQFVDNAIVPKSRPTAIWAISATLPQVNTTIKAKDTADVYESFIRQTLKFHVLNSHLPATMSDGYTGEQIQTCSLTDFLKNTESYARVCPVHTHISQYVPTIEFLVIFQHFFSQYIPTVSQYIPTCASTYPHCSFCTHNFFKSPSTYPQFCHFPRFSQYVPTIKDFLPVHTHNLIFHVGTYWEMWVCTGGMWVRFTTHNFAIVGSTLF